MNGHINYQLEHFEIFLLFLNFFIFLSYLIVPRNASESTYFSIFSVGACS